MQRDFTVRKRLILAGLAALVTADFAMAAYGWRLSSAPHTPKQQLAQERTQLELLRADIRRAQNIREKMPSTQVDCDKFEHGLRTPSNGYSAITAEMGVVASPSPTAVWRWSTWMLRSRATMSAWCVF